MLLGLAMALFTACKEQGPVRYSSESPEIETVKTLIADYEAGHWDAYKVHYADTAKIYHNTPDAVTPAQMAEAHQATTGAFSSYAFNKDNLFVEMVIDNDGEKWVNYWAPWQGTLAENGKELTVPVHLTLQFVDGKIVEEYGYYDRSPLVMALAEIDRMKNLPENEARIMATYDTFVDFWNKHDLQDLKNSTSGNIVRYTNGVKTATNQKEYEDFASFFFTAFPDLYFTIQDFHTKDGKTYHYWTGTGTHTGMLGDLAPTGKKIVTHGHTVWTFDTDGKIVRDDSYMDNQQLYEQLGYTLSPPE